MSRQTQTCFIMLFSAEAILQREYNVSCLKAEARLPVRAGCYWMARSRAPLL